MLRLRSTLLSLFPVRADEVNPLGFLVLLSFFRGLAAVFFDAPANTLFITRFGSGPLPYVYLCAAGSSLLIGFIYSKLGAALPPARALRITLTALLVSILLFYISLLINPAKWLIMGLMIWKETLFMLGNIVMWASAGYLFNVRQGKRLFGLVASGGILATIIGGALIPKIVKAAGTVPLFLLSALSLGAMLFVLSRITRHYRGQFQVSMEAQEIEPPKAPFRDLLKNRYLGLFFSLSILSNFGFFFVDYVYFNRVESAYPDEAALAGFFGLFASIIGFVQLIASTFLSGPLITRFGLGFGLMALPALNVVGMGLASVVGLQWGASNTFFWLIIATKLCDEVLRFSLLAPSFRILYQPLPVQERLRFQAVTESIIEPIGVGLAGGVLLLFTHFYPISLHALCMLLVVILVTWLAVGERLRREYTRLLTKALSKRRLTDISIALEDGSTVQVFEEGLQSKKPGEVLYCLNMLEEIRHPQLVQFLIERLNHPDESVRISAIEKLETKGSMEDLPRLKEQLRIETVPKVRGVILQTLCALAEADAVEAVTAYLDDPSPEVRSGAMAGLMRHGGIDGVLAAGARLQTMVASHHSEDRLFAAQALGEIGIRSFYRPLLQLLNDPEIQVRQAAVRAAGSLNNPKLLVHLLECLEVPSLRSLAFTALVHAGESAIPVLVRSFHLCGQPSASRQRLLKLIGKIGGEAAISALKPSLSYPDKSLRRQILQALSHCHYKAADDEVETLRKRVKIETEGAAKILAIRRDLGSNPLFEPVRQALQNEVRNHQDQILLLLSFLYDSRSLLYARKELESRSSTQRAHALELVENVVENDLKQWVLPLLDDLSPEERMERLRPLFPSSKLSAEERLRELIVCGPAEITPWTKACALHVMGRMKISGNHSLIQPLCESAEPLLRETAEWTLKQTQGVV